jgi:hypothetical protein
MGVISIRRVFVCFEKPPHRCSAGVGKQALPDALIGVELPAHNRHYLAPQTGDSSDLKPLNMCRHVRVNPRREATMASNRYWARPGSQGTGGVFIPLSGLRLHRLPIRRAKVEHSI